MFMCARCHNVDNHPFEPRSYGPCEGCGKTATTVDCHQSHCSPKKGKGGRSGKKLNADKRR